jgi:hypothetical protein
MCLGVVNVSFSSSNNSIAGKLPSLLFLTELPSLLLIRDSVLLDCVIPVNKLMLSRLSVLLKTSRAPVVISQRRPVTEEEKDLALRKANEFKSKYPFTVQIMMESYVYVGFFMVMSLISQSSSKLFLVVPA